MIYDFKNFYVSTVADWTRCEIPSIKPDFVSFAGSAYWDYGNRVRRLSDHWGTVASCYWLLEGKQINVFTCAECDYDEFRNIWILKNDIHCT